MAISDKVRLVSTVARIATSIAWERWGSSPVPVSAKTVPPSAESITRQWLTSVLCSNIPGAQVVDVSVAGGSDGTSARRAITVAYNAAGREAGLPERLFSKSTATFGSRMLLGITGIAEGESVF